MDSSRFRSRRWAASATSRGAPRSRALSHPSLTFSSSRQAPPPAPSRSAYASFAIHGKLLAGGRGAEKEPGEFRRSQNWIGGSRPGKAFFVPPPAERLTELLGPLEKFLHDDPVKTPTLLKTALVHVQFESIQPFLDGNGRLGRLLITLILCEERALTQPLLYLSLYFKQNRTRYYDLLQRVRTDGDWES